MKTVIYKRSKGKVVKVATYKYLIPLSEGDDIVYQDRFYEVYKVTLNIDEQQLEIEFYKYE